MDLRAYVVTDPGCNANWGRSNADAVRKAVAGGATIVQIREKGADGGTILQQVPESPATLPDGFSNPKPATPHAGSLVYLEMTNLERFGFVPSRFLELYVSMHLPKPGM